MRWLLPLFLLATPAFAAEDKPIFEGKLTELAGKGSAGEGPAWDPKLGILTSGADDNIHRFSRDGQSSIHRKDAGTNGLLFDTEGRLVACEPKLRRVTRTEADGTIKVLTDSFEGKKYNTP